MRKFIPSFVVLTIILAGYFATPSSVSATSNPLKTVHLQETQLGNVFTFEQLGYSEKLMIGPFDSSSLAFSLPANIKLATGSSISLKYALAWSGGTDNESPTAGVAGTLLVYFNDEVIDTIILDSEAPSEKEILIPDKALNVIDQDGRYRLRFSLSAGMNCQYANLRTTLVISESSLLNFQYETVTPAVDLSLIPRPFYQPDSIIPNSVLVVTPDNPEAFELEAALNTMAGLGSITNGEMNVKLVLNGSLTPEMLKSSHLIFVGLAQNFPELQSVNFPISTSGNGLAIAQGHETDGVIEMALSPWEPSYVVLLVGGNSPAAVVKASQAFSTGNIIAVEKPDISLISTVNPSNAQLPATIDQTFQEIGYGPQTVGLYGENYISYVFYASPEQARSTGAYVDLVLSHSDLLDYESTGVSILLNDEVIGGVRLTEDSPVTQQIKIAPNVLRSGINRLEILSNVVPYYKCYSTDLLSTWITVSETSNIHLPISEEKLDVGQDFNLHDFPYMFLSDRSLSDLAFILAHDDVVSWNYASQVAYYIGSKGSVPLVSLHAAYADDVSEEVLNQYNLLVFGRASTLPFISQINDLLPAPFKSGSDEAVQPSMLVNYSLLPETSVGYLQILPSPWNKDHVILAVLGNTSDGIPMAGTTLTKDDLVARLSGNFAVLYSDQAVTTDTRLGVSKESIISQLPVAVTVTPALETEVTPSLATSQEIESRPAWIIPVFAVVTLFILGFLVIMLRREAVANKKPKDVKSHSEDSSDAYSGNN
jgi:hypothetical protein